MADIDDTGVAADYDDEGDLIEDELGAELEVVDDQEKIAFKKLYQSHPECVLDYVEETVKKIPLKVTPPRRVSALELANKIVAKSDKDSESEKAALPPYDENHITYPFLTKYEHARIIGFRSNQLAQGAQPFIIVPDHVSDVREIARMELAEKRLPYIIKRPLPDGKYEYWRLQDLMQI